MNTKRELLRKKLELLMARHEIRMKSVTVGTRYGIKYYIRVDGNPFTLCVNTYDEPVKVRPGKLVKEVDCMITDRNVDMLLRMCESIKMLDHSRYGIKQEVKV